MTDIKRVRLLVDNALRGPDTTLELVGTPVSGYPLSNLQHPDRTALCKVAFTSTMGVKAFVDASAGVGAMALTGLAYDPAAQFRLRSYSVSGWGTPSYDSGWLPAYPSPFGYGIGGYGSWGFGGIVNPTLTPYYRPSVVLFFPETRFDSWWWLQIDNGAEAPELGLGVFALCNVIQLSRNFSDGWKIGSRDNTTMLRTTDGSLRAGRPGTRRAVISADFRGLPREDRYFFHNTMQRLGVATPFFLVMHPEDGGFDSPWTTLYCVAQYSEQTVTGPFNSDFSISFEEL